MESEKILRLRGQELIRMRGDHTGTVISCREGTLWLTQTNRPGDHLILAGEAFSIDRPGRILISALEDSVCAVWKKKQEPPCSAWSFMPPILRMARRIEVVRKGLLT